MSRFKRRFKASQGLALVEVLVAVMILSTSSIFVLQALSRTAVLEREINHLGSSLAFASNKMAELEALSLTGAEFKQKQKGSFTHKEQSFQWQMIARPYSGALPLRHITLDVTWKQGEEDYKRRVESLVQLPAEEETV
jgi:Tfp pilus assembly protein PilE